MALIAGRCSIVIPAFNAESTIGEAVTSVLNQKYPDLEVIVVDDGSTDTTAERAKEFDHCVVLLRQENRGVSAARNHGLTQASGEFILFLDADDWLLEGAIPRLLQALQEDAGMVAAYGEAVRASSEGRIEIASTGAFLTHRHAGEVLDKLVLQNFIVSPGVLCARTSVVRAVGGFQEELRVAEDWVLWCALACVGYFAYVPTPPVLAYREGEHSVVQSTGLRMEETQACIDAVFRMRAVQQRLGARLSRYRRWRRASAHSFVATQHLKRADFPAARRNLIQSLRGDPRRLRDWVLLPFAAARWLPACLRKRLK